MFYVYVLKSKIRNYFYTGYSENLKKRIVLHQNRMVQSTSPYVPFELIYYEACLNKTDAYLREKYLKSRIGKQFIKKRLKYWFKNK